MSSTPFVAHEARRQPAHDDEPRAVSPHAEAWAAEADSPAPPRDALDLMLLHGDCAFLLDQWAL
jgi:hypothetical protein